MIVYNYDADLEVSDTCVRSSLLSSVENFNQTTIHTGDDYCLLIISVLALQVQSYGLVCISLFPVNLFFIQYSNTYANITKNNPHDCQFLNHAHLLIIARRSPRSRAELNSTQLNRELRTQVSDTSKSAS